MYRFIYHKEYKLLKKYTRVIDTLVINFYLVSISYCFLGDTFKYTKKTLRTDYNEKNIPDNDLYRINMMVKSLGYEILSQNWEIMTTHEDVK